MGASCLGFISIIVVFVTILVSWVIVVRDVWHWRRRRRAGARGFDVVRPARGPTDARTGPPAAAGPRVDGLDSPHRPPEPPADRPQ